METTELLAAQPRKNSLDAFLIFRTHEWNNEATMQNYFSTR